MVVLPQVQSDAAADIADGQALSAPLLYWEQKDWQDDSRRGKKGDPVDPWSFGDAFQGTQVFGGTGSGKTSGSGRTLALALLAARYAGRHRFGGLVLCAKPDEVALWANFNDRLTDATGRKVPLGYCALAKRSPDDIVVFGVNLPYYKALGLRDIPEGGYFFDYLEYMDRLSASQGSSASTSPSDAGTFTHTLVSLFQTVLEGGAQESSNADPYWNDAIRQMLTNAIDLIKLAKPHVSNLSVSVGEINQIILSAPQSRDATRSAAFQRGRCWQLLHAAEAGTRRELAQAAPGSEARARLVRTREDLRSTIDYWLRDFAGLTDRVRSVVESSFTSKATGLLRRPMSELFSPSAHRRAVTPEETHRGKIVILDLSVKEFGELGRFAQILYKTVWQRATEHPRRRSHPSPVFLWADESQYFVTSEDARFQQTARSNKVATVYMTQNISNYYVSLAGRAGNAATDSLIGNFQTKIFHANTDPATNEWAERLFGEEKVTLRGRASGGLNNPSNTKNESWLPAIPASSFLGLLKGGTLAQFKVEAYVCVAGHQWVRPNEEKKLDSRPGVLVTFQQRLLQPGDLSP